MKFSQLLAILNCYIGQEKSQLNFMYLCFQRVMVPPYTEEDSALEENDNYYPFSKKSEESTAKKVYSGERPLAKATARFVKGHFDGRNLASAIDEMDDVVKENLCNDLKKYGVPCDIDSVGDVVSPLFLQFVEAAIDENDTIQTGLSASAEIRAESGDATNQDTLLLIEVGNKCPLCNAPLLVRNGKGKNVKRYKITQILPDHVSRDLYLTFSKHSRTYGNYDHPDNLIAMCTECSTDYLSEPTEEEFLHLLAIKKALQQRNKLLQGMDDVGLESEISEVVNGMKNIDRAGELVELRMDALKVRQKIEPTNKLLIDSVTDDVTHYYCYIESLFADIDGKESGTFDRIASEVRLAYQKIKNEGLSQEAVFKYMADWLKEKMPIGQRNDMAINAVISFFIQNCEVFDEISE